MEAAALPPVTLKITQTFGQKWNGSITISLSATGLALKQQIAQACGESPGALKVLCAGRFVKNDLSLADQKIRANVKLMVMPEANEEQKQKFEESEVEQAKLSRLVSAAETLASRTDNGDDYYAPTTVEICNQHGQKMNLLPADKRGLTVGMSLHDKGKQLVSKGNLHAALDVLVQAETEGFSKCSQEVLALVDNFGLLCLDISWVLFKLQKTDQLRDAAWRLDKAEECLRRTYGQNFERLRLLKGGAGGAELVSFVRLWLLQGIVAYHSNSRAAAQRFFDQAEERLKVLRITDEELVSLLGMGFSARESRVALRACERDQERAVMYIFTKREEKKQQREREQKERSDRREQRRFGKTAGGDWVNMHILKALTEAGFERKLVAAGLRQTDNDELQTLTLLTETPDVLRAAVQSQEGAQWLSKNKVKQLVSMGFSTSQARTALLNAMGDVQNAADALLRGDIPADSQGTEDSLPMDETEDSTEEPKPEESTSPDLGAAMADTPVEAPPEKSAEEIEREQREEREKQLQQEVENDILDAVVTDADAHLDGSLEEEFAVLTEYKALLAQAQ